MRVTNSWPYRYLLAVRSPSLKAPTATGRKARRRQNCSLSVPPARSGYSHCNSLLEITISVLPALSHYYILILFVVSASSTLLRPHPHSFFSTFYISYPPHDNYFFTVPFIAIFYSTFRHPVLPSLPSSTRLQNLALPDFIPSSWLADPKTSHQADWNGASLSPPDPSCRETLRQRSISTITAMRMVL